MIYTLSNDSLTIKINSFGAELQSIFDNHSNQELLWQANKQHWARHAPILFPIVGKLQNDELKTAGNSYPISQHGFARDSEFSLLSQDDTSIELQLKNSEKTKIHFPFEFELNIKYKLENTGLRCTFNIRNPSKQVLPFSLGGHPAFNWPLSPNIPKEKHRIIFNKDETGLMSQLENGLIKDDGVVSPIIHRTLHLKDDLFNKDALIFKDVRSDSIRYEAVSDDGEVAAFIEMKFSDFNDLGIWMKPGATFVCLEPWLGYSSSVDFDGDFIEKAGLIHLDPESSRNFCFEINVS